MNVYWKSAVNQMMSEEAFNQSLKDVYQQILLWAQNELSLNGELLASFVKEKVEEYERSFIKIEMPFVTEMECRAYLQDFYDQYAEVIQVFPYDRWAWIQKLESIQYGDYEIECVKVPSQLVDCKEMPVT